MYWDCSFGIKVFMPKWATADRKYCPSSSSPNNSFWHVLGLQFWPGLHPTNQACRHDVGSEAASSQSVDTTGRKSPSTCCRPVCSQRQPRGAVACNGSFCSIGTGQWLRGSGCRRAAPSHLCTAGSRRICDHMVYPGARCGMLS